jgi:hypothetical protein
MAIEQPLTRKNDDGSVDVWYRGWRARYPPGGGKPEFLAEADPPEDAEAVGSDVKYAESEFTRGNWLVVLEEQGPVAVRVKRKRVLAPVLRLFAPRFRR